MSALHRSVVETRTHVGGGGDRVGYDTAAAGVVAVNAAQAEGNDDELKLRFNKA